MYDALIEGRTIMVSQQNRKDCFWLRMPSKFESVIIVFMLIVAGFTTYQLEMTLAEKKQIVVEQEQFIEIMNQSNAALALWREHLIERERMIGLREQRLDDSKQVINYKVPHRMVKL